MSLLPGIRRRAGLWAGVVRALGLACALVPIAPVVRAAEALPGGVRLRDLATVLQARDNQLVGFGLVSGIAGDGDRNPVYTLQSVANMMQRFGITLDPARITSKNLAAVMVTADIPPFSKPGARLDVLVSSMGDAKTLQGGVLLQTPLIGADGKVYAVAQGAVSIGGFSASSGGNSITKNHPTSGQIIGGGLVEKGIPVTMMRDRMVEMILREPDFTLAARAAEAVNRRFPDACRALDGATLQIRVPQEYEASPIDFVAQVQSIEVRPDVPARVILNERTGTVVATSRVQITSCAIAHGSLVVSVAQSSSVSQPNPLAPNGQTVTTQNTDLNVTEPKGGLLPLEEMPTVEKVAASLNAVGATPRDIIAIFQALKQAGALQAELLIR